MLNLSHNNLGKNQDNIKYLSEIMKQLPNNLQNLSLNLPYNDLGGNIYNMKYLAEGMKQLPSTLQNL